MLQATGIERGSGFSDGLHQIGSLFSHFFVVCFQAVNHLNENLNIVPTLSHLSVKTLLSYHVSCSG